jgi:hypothetical protein
LGPGWGEIGVEAPGHLAGKRRALAEHIAIDRTGARFATGTSHLLSCHFQKVVDIMPHSNATNSVDVLNRTIDRFLFAAGWRVKQVSQRTDGGGYDVTLIKETQPNQGVTVMRTASSAGEATLKACSSARLWTAPAGQD